MALKLTNNAISNLAANISAASTSITLVPGDGVKFPTLGVGDWFPATIVKPTGVLEVVQVTARSTDTLTVVRAQEGTSAKSFDAGDRIELRFTAGAAQSIQDVSLAGVAALQVQVDGIDTDLAAAVASIAALDASTDASVLDLQQQINDIPPPPDSFPVGFGPVPWSRPTEPAGWIFADGRTLTGATPYTALRSAYITDGFPFGQDGSGNPKIPDMRGRVPAGKDNMGGTAANRLTTAGSGVDGAMLGAAGGDQTHTLTTTQIPAHTHNLALKYVTVGGAGSSRNYWTRSGPDTLYDGTVTNGATSTGGGLAHNNTQPTLVTGYIIKT